MIDIGAVVLKKILEEKSLEAWSRVKLAFLDPAYSGLYAVISKYYNKYNGIPGFDELELSVKDSSLNRSINALKELEVPDIDIDIVIDALINNYTQAEAIKLLNGFVDKVTLMDSDEIKESLSDIVMRLDEKVHNSEKVVTMDTINVFEEPGFIKESIISLGLNNTFDANVSTFRQELVLVGGKKGSGKSLVCANVVSNQYESGNVAVYFTIEMTARETLNRMMAILANVEHKNIKQDSLTFEETCRLAKVKTGMFQDAEDVYQEFLVHKDRIKFEKDLGRSKILKPDNQIIIIDDREMSLSAIDLHLVKLKAQFGDKLTVAAIDYLNQIVVPGKQTDMYDWLTQIFVSKKLKEFARKHGILIVSPYQIDDSGGTRFAKGILDAPDIALILDAHSREDAAITMTTAKIRGAQHTKFTSSMNWDTLRITPVDVTVSEKEKKPKKTAEDKEPGDLPW